MKEYVVIELASIYESLGSIDNPVGELPSGTTVQMIENNLGDSTQFAKIIHDEKERFIRTYFLSSSAPLEDVFLDKSYVTGDGVSQIKSNYPTETKIKDIPLDKPYKENGKYGISIDTGFVSIKELNDNLELETQENIKFDALKSLLEYYGKKIPEDSVISKIINGSLKYVTVSEPYLPVRPCHTIRVKIEIDEKYFEVFENLSFEQYTVDNIHKNFISINLAVNKINETITNLVKIMEQYDGKLLGFEGEMLGLNFKNLSNKSRRFLTDFKKFLAENGVVVDGDDNNKLEIGFEKDELALEYVLYYNPYGKFLTVGKKALSELVDPKLAKLLISHRDIQSAASSGMNWMDFTKTYFTGEAEIKFSKSTDIAGGSKKSLTDIELELDEKKADFDDLVTMTVEELSGLQNLKKDPEFLKSSTELLMRSKDLVGDQFLINLPDVLANVQDLESLYSLVFDKVSIKDVLDIMMEKIGSKMNIPDLNEIKLRGILKAIDAKMALDILFDFVSPNLQQYTIFMQNLSNVLNISKAEIVTLNTALIKYVPDYYNYFLNFVPDGQGSYNPQGLIVDYYIESGNSNLGLEKKLEELGITSPEELQGKIEDEIFNIEDFYQEEAFNGIVSHILTNGLEEQTFSFTDPVTQQDVQITIPSFSISDLQFPIFDFFKKMDTSVIKSGIDLYFKKRFKNAQSFAETENRGENTNNFSVPETPSQVFNQVISIPKIKLEFDKLNLTKEKLLSKAPNLDLQFENKKTDANFSLPSIKDINPSFDFSSFEFDGVGDIFGSAVEQIEKGIIEGIEVGLVGAFKSMLNTALDTLNLDNVNLDNPDFGGLNFNDLLDATAGFSADKMADVVAEKFKGQVSKDEIKATFDSMSNCLKPMELTRIMKGQKNSRDYENLKLSIPEGNMRDFFTQDNFNEVFDIMTDYSDIDMIEELEEAYDNAEVYYSVCERSGIPYKLKGGVRDVLENKYEDMDEKEIDDLVDSILDEVKDAMVDSIGNIKDNFQENLPFDDNPCSFMPKQSEIEPLKYANDIAFDAIFEPIKLEYKNEAATVPDMFLISTPSDTYVPLYYLEGDAVLYSVDEDTVPPEIVFKSAEDMPGWDSSNKRIYNEEFNNHHIGRATKYYEYNSENDEYIEIDDDDIKLTINDDEQWEITEGDYKQVYIIKDESVLRPVPFLSDFLDDPEIVVAGTTSLVNAGAYDDFQVDMDLLVSIGARLSTTTSFSDKFFYTKSSTVYQYLAVADGVPYEYVDDCNAAIKADHPINPTSSHFYVKFARHTEYGRYFDEEFIGDLSNSLVSFRGAGYEDDDFWQDGSNNDWDINYYNPDTQTPSSNSAPELFVYRQNPPPSNNSLTINTLQTLAKRGSEHPSELLNEHDVYLRNMYWTIREILKGFRESDLFDVDEMMAFVIDDDTINLLNTDDAKNSAKEDFSENCSFEEGGRGIKGSSIKKLLYLTIRLYIIEEVIKNCFWNSLVYETEASDDYPKYIFDKIDSDMKLNYKSYYDEYFKENYKKEYGEAFDNKSKVFDETVKKIYSAVADHFPRLFRNADQNILYFIFRNALFDGEYTPDNRGIIKMAKNATENKIADSRFVIQREVIVDDGSGKRAVPYSDQINVNTIKKINLRLGYVFNYSEAYDADTVQNKRVTLLQEVMRRNPSNYDDYMLTELGRAIYPLGNTLNSNYQEEASLNPKQYFKRLKDTISLDIIGYHKRRVSDNKTELYADYLTFDHDPASGVAGLYHIMPVFQTSIIEGFDEIDLSTKKLTMDLMLDNPDEVESFKDLYRLDAFLNFIKNLFDLQIRRIKPEFVNMFKDTKAAIMKAVKTLSQSDDAYDFEQNESFLTQMEQAQEVSTMPDFSPKASKMALMTVPMIIKGMAESFDPNTKVASAIRKLADLKGFNISPFNASLMALPMNIIPFAPGPPIGPLGLLYIATSFLDPKERKQLSSIKRGDRRNIAADEETGGLSGGSIIEQQAEATEQFTEQNIEDAEFYVSRHSLFSYMAHKVVQFLYEQIETLRKSAQAGGVMSNLTGNPRGIYLQYPAANVYLSDFTVTYSNVDGYSELVSIDIWLNGTVNPAELIPSVSENSEQYVIDRYPKEVFILSARGQERKIPYTTTDSLDTSKMYDLMRTGTLFHPLFYAFDSVYNWHVQMDNYKEISTRLQYAITMGINEGMDAGIDRLASFENHADAINALYGFMKIEANIYLYGLWLYYCIRRLKRLIDLENSNSPFGLSPEGAIIQAQRPDDLETSPEDLIIQTFVDTALPDFTGYTDTALRATEPHSRIPDIGSYFNNLFNRFCNKLNADEILDFDIDRFFEEVVFVITDINSQVFPLGALNSTLSAYLTDVDNVKLKVLSHAIGYDQVANPSGDKLTLTGYVSLLRLAVLDGVMDERFKNVTKENFTASNLQDDTVNEETAESKFIDCSSHTETSLDEALQEIEARFIELRQVLLST